jgi:hypothetical protein
MKEAGRRAGLPVDIPGACGFRRPLGKKPGHIIFLEITKKCRICLDIER